jgi:hypothetical protein
VSVVGAIVSLPGIALADGMTRDQCINANEQAGQLRKAGKLRDARTSLRLCSADVCPAAVRRDCLAGAERVDADVPSITLSAQDPTGNDLAAVRVSIDGQLVAERLDGKPVEVDPGEHVFRFEAAGLPPLEKRLVIVEAEKNRRERVQLGEPKPVAAPAPAPPPQPPPVAAEHHGASRRSVGFVVGGVGLGVMAVGGVAGILAVAEWSSAKDACGTVNFPLRCNNPSQASSDRSTTLAAGAVADIGLGVGAVALVTGAVLVLLPPATNAGSSSARLVLSPAVGSASGFTLHGSF